MENKYVKKPWLRSYEPICVPETLEPYPETPYTEFFIDANAKDHPNDLALVQLDCEMTYKELKEHVGKLATALADLGIKKGDVVATVLTSSIQFVLCNFAIPKIGAVHLCGNVMDSVERMVEIFGDANVKTIICSHTNVRDRDVIDKVKEAAKNVGIENIILTHTRDYSSIPPRHEEDGVIWLTDLIEKYPPNPPKVDIDPKKDKAFLIYTGGTTGVPKGCMHAHYSLVAHPQQYWETMFPQSMVSLIKGISIRTLIIYPLFVVTGHVCVDITFFLGGTVIIAESRDYREMVRLAKKYHPPIVMGTPTQLSKLSKEEGAESMGILGGTGGAAFAPKAQTDFEEKGGSLTVETYGISETEGLFASASTVSMMAPFVGGRETVGKIFSLLDRVLKMPGIVPLVKMFLRILGPGNLGRIINMVVAFVSENMLATPLARKMQTLGSAGIPMVDVDIKIANEDTGETIPIEKVVKEKLRGEMCVKTPSQMLGYWPELGTGFDEEGYIHTGDVGTLDEWGQIFIVDRTKDMVNISGYKVYTRILDDMLYDYPGIDEAAVIGIPDPERPGSERLKAFIVLEQDYKGKVKEEDIIEFLRGKVQPYAVPKSVEFRDELPMTTAEKIFKRKLREEEIEKMKKEGILK